MKVCSINSRGFNLRKELLVFDRAKGFDLFLVQETFVSDLDHVKRLSSRWPGASFWSPAVGKQGGVCVLVHEHFQGKIVNWRRDSDGRVLSLLVEFGDSRFNLLNIYAPAVLTDRKGFFDSLHQYFIPADGIVIGGDFNCYEADLDKFGGNVSVANYLSEFRRNFNFIDVWRKKHPRVREMSWFNSTFAIGSRLDKFFVSPNLARFAVRCEISPCCLSDHDFVDLHINTNSLPPRGPGIWKFNNALLKDSAFCDFVSERIADLSSCIDSFDSVRSWWDFFKESLKCEIVSFAKRKCRQLSYDRVRLTNRLIALKQRLAQGDTSVSILIATLESQLQVLVLQDLEGRKTRSRAQWLEEGEKPTRYFFKLERERFEKNQVTSILDDTGTEVSSRQEIERAHVAFYTKLFTEELIDFQSKQQCLNSFTRFLPEEDCSFCEEPISLLDLSDSVKSLSYGKSPGPDGFSVEFYVCFWNLLGPLLLRVAETCFLAGELCDSMKGSVTRLIYKKRGDIKDLKNWRPISLLNVDYKILSKAITLRLSQVLHSVVAPDQTCSIPGRSILSNVTLIRDIFDYIDITREPAILLNLDQEKAFDRVNRSFMLDLLRHLGFGSNFCRWFQTFYNGAFMQIILNGFLTDRIPLGRGVRQGDPLSPLLYVLCVEGLACLIRNSNRVNGFLLPGAKGQCATVRLYADDTTAILKDFSSLLNLFDLVSIYESGTGAKLNVTKTEAMWLGSWKDRTDQPLGLKWVRKMKILGVTFGTISVEQDNWQPKLNKLEKALNLWKSRSLSLLGKSLIVNVMGFSKLLYLAKVLEMPSWVLAKVNQLVWPFIWGSRIETVSRQTCFLSEDLGGINLCNLKLKCESLRVASLVTVISSSEDSCYFLCKYFVGRRLSSLRSQWWSLRDNSAPSAVSPTSFYKSCLEVLQRLHNDVELRVKKVYAFLLRERSSAPLLPGFWSSFLGPFCLSSFWKFVRDGFTENYKNDLLWLIVLRAVKVRASLRNWGYIDNSRCASCNRVETIAHCFLDCPRVKEVWAHFAPFFSNFIGTPFRSNIVTVFFFRWDSRDSRKNRVVSFLLKTILYAIWTFRNKATFRNGSEDHRAIIRYASQDFHNRVNLDYYRLTSTRFAEFWSFPSLISLRHNKLVFLL